jgi:hypothetical protein
MLDLGELLAKAHAYGGPSTMAPSVLDAEAHVATWHAIVIQGGWSSPEREAWRLAADRQVVTRAEADANSSGLTNESAVDMALVISVLGADVVGTQQFSPPAEPVFVQKFNDRGEFVLDNGKLYHHAPFDPATGTGPDTATHEGDWLSCETCNPVSVLRAQPATELADLRARYDELKRVRDAATEEFDAVKTKLQTALSEASDGALRSALYVDGFKPMTLTYTEPWTVDSKRLKAEQPAVYVEFAKRGQRWTLAESRAKS